MQISRFNNLGTLTFYGKKPRITYREKGQGTLSNRLGPQGFPEMDHLDCHSFSTRRDIRWASSVVGPPLFTTTYM